MSFNWSAHADTQQQVAACRWPPTLAMGSVAPEFPFFVSNVPRALTAQEQADDLRWRLEAMPSVSVVCACVDDEIVGFKIGYAHSQSRYYSWLGGVKPQRRRRGIGAQMMELQHAQAAEQGFAFVETATMHMLEDTIVAISPEREKFFGCSGRMLLPCPATVAAAIKEIPHGRVTTLDALRNALAQRAGVDVACPFQTKQAVLAIASQSGTVPYWRLVKKNGDVLKYLPGGAQNHAARLAEEGVGTEQTVHGTRVKDLKNKLHAFDSDAV